MTTYIRSWSEGRDFIARGRSKVDRPLGSNARIRLGASEDVVIRVHSTDVVRFHPDG